MKHAHIQHFAQRWRQHTERVQEGNLKAGTIILSQSPGFMFDDPRPQVIRFGLYPWEVECCWPFFLIKHGQIHSADQYFPVIFMNLTEMTRDPSCFSFRLERVGKEDPLSIQGFVYLDHIQRGTA